MDQIGKIAQNPVGAAIARAAEATGVDFAHLMETARRESSFNPLARAATSSATGLFQFIDSTWLEMVGRHGAKHGLAEAAQAIDLSGKRPRVSDAATRAEILSLRTNPELAARMAGELTRENASILEARLGRAPTGGDLYAAHVLGPVGAARLIKAAEAGAPSAAALFPREAEANRNLFFTRDGAARSAAQLLQRLELQAGGEGAPGGPLLRAAPPARLDPLDLLRPSTTPAGLEQDAVLATVWKLLEGLRAWAVGGDDESARLFGLDAYGRAAR
jgi:hypothetical protein